MSETNASRLTIQDLKDPKRSRGEKFRSILLVRRVNNRIARNNNPFLQVEFGDRFGSFSIVCFNDSPLFPMLQSGAEGKAAAVEGEIDHYQGRLSPKLTSLTFLTEEELREPNVTDSLVASSSEDLSEMMNELEDFIESIEHEQIRATVENVFEEIGPIFRESTAAIAMHHAYRGGLLEHTIHMARVCRALLPLYKEVDPDLALAGCLLHDTGKCLEYSGNLAVKKTRLGILQGHVVLGYRLVRKAGMIAKLSPDLLERLEHIVLSHQGELEWGAAAMAATPEAVFVSMIDNLDARMGMVQEALRQTHPEQEFSDFIPGLQAPLLVVPPATIAPFDPADLELEEVSDPISKSPGPVEGLV